MNSEEELAEPNEQQRIEYENVIGNLKIAMTNVEQYLFDWFGLYGDYDGFSQSWFQLLIDLEKFNPVEKKEPESKK